MSVGKYKTKKVMSYFYVVVVASSVEVFMKYKLRQVYSRS